LMAGIKGTGNRAGACGKRVKDVLRLGGGGAQDYDTSVMSSKTARLIRFLALGLNVWGWMAVRPEPASSHGPQLAGRERVAPGTKSLRSRNAGTLYRSDCHQPCCARGGQAASHLQASATHIRYSVRPVR
jgi:hypothetical protein